MDFTFKNGLRIVVREKVFQAMRDFKAATLIKSKHARNIARAHEHGPAFVFIMLKDVGDKRLAVTLSLILRVCGDIFQLTRCVIDSGNHAHAF